MRTFVAGAVIAVILAVATGFGLNAVSISSEHAFSTEETRL